jgi:hypothetical protein
MSILVLSLALGTGLFLVGYYFGNHMGRTHFVRNYLAEVRKSRQ